MHDFGCLVAARGVMSVDRTVHGIDIRFHESARIDPERIVDIVGTGERIVFVPPTTLRVANHKFSFGSVFEHRGFVAGDHIGI